MSRFFGHYKSISTRLSITTSLIASLLVLGIAFYAFLLKSKESEMQDRYDLELSLSNAALTINRTQLKVEITMNANIWGVDKCVTNNLPDSVVDILANVVSINPFIDGAGVVFNVERDDPLHPPYILYVGNDGKPSEYYMARAQIFSDKGDGVWIREALSDGKSAWSVPHPMIDNTKIQVCTFTIPVDSHRDNERVVFFADLPVNLIDSIVEAHNTDLVSQAFIINYDGRNVLSVFAGSTHDDKALNLSSETARYLMSKIPSDAVIGQAKWFEDQRTGKKYDFFYGLVNRSGWVLFYIPENSVITPSFLRAALTVLVIFVLTVLGLFWILSYVINRITSPLKHFSDSAIEISKGNFNAELPLVGDTEEMTLLRESFEKMQGSLAAYIKQLEESTRSSAYMMSELEIANNIQTDLLPKDYPPFPDRDDINIKAVLIPAKQVGGDLYNYFIRDDKLYFIIADVSGKGVPGALVMAIANNEFKTISSRSSDPAEIMRCINDTTCTNNHHTGYFITAIVGILDLKTNLLNVCNAGHDPAILIDAEGNCSLLKLMPNLPIGVIDGYNYTSKEIALQPNTRLLLYTDGITNAEDENGKFYGINRLLSFVNAHISDDTSELVDSVISDVQSFIGNGELTDDITLMALEFNPSDMQMPAQIAVFNDMNELNKVAEFSSKIADTMGLDETLKMKLNIVLEEAVTNIIKYSFSRSGHNTITLYASAHRGILTIIISDTGAQFDPTRVIGADTTAPLEQRPIGGLGITLMRNITTHMDYSRQNNHNYLTLRFDFSTSD